MSSVPLLGSATGSSSLASSDAPRALDKSEASMDRIADTNAIISYPDKQSEPFPFLKLPLDIRLMVYEQLPRIVKHVVLENSKFSGRPIKTTLVSHSIAGSILRTCKIVYQEAAPILNKVHKQCIVDHGIKIVSSMYEISEDALFSVLKAVKRHQINSSNSLESYSKTRAKINKRLHDRLADDSWGIRTLDGLVALTSGDITAPGEPLSHAITDLFTFVENAGAHLRHRLDNASHGPRPMMELILTKDEIQANHPLCLEEDDYENGIYNLDKVIKWCPVHDIVVGFAGWITPSEADKLETVQAPAQLPRSDTYDWTVPWPIEWLDAMSSETWENEWLEVPPCREKIGYLEVDVKEQGPNTELPNHEGVAG